MRNRNVPEYQQNNFDLSAYLRIVGPMVVVIGTLVVDLHFVLRLSWVYRPVEKWLELLSLLNRLRHRLSMWWLQRPLEIINSSKCYSTALLLIVLLDIRRYVFWVTEDIKI